MQLLLRTALSNQIEKLDLASSTGTILATLRKDNRHQIVLDNLLNRFAGWLATAEAPAAGAGTTVERPETASQGGAGVQPRVTVISPLCVRLPMFVTTALAVRVSPTWKPLPPT